MVGGGRYAPSTYGGRVVDMVDGFDANYAHLTPYAHLLYYAYYAYMKQYIKPTTALWLFDREDQLNEAAAKEHLLADRRALSAAAKAVGRVRRKYTAPPIPPAAANPGGPS